MDARRIWTLYETFKGRKVAERIQQINEETHRIKGMYMTNVDLCVKIQCDVIFCELFSHYKKHLHIYTPYIFKYYYLSSIYTGGNYNSFL